MSAFEDAVTRARYVLHRLKMPKLYPRVCNICGYEGLFGPAEMGRRIDAKCPRCKSAERYRLFKLWLDWNEARIRGKRVLHFAPEKSMVAMLRQLAGSYQSADLEPGRADIVLDIERIALPDASVDCVVCSHVLEHVDDRRALPEIFRVLKPGGCALIMIPLVEGWARSYENSAITTEEERTLHFGQYNHVRFYGADVRDRIRAAGFGLEEFTAEGEAVIRHGLLRGEKVFVATKA